MDGAYFIPSFLASYRAYSLLTVLCEIGHHFVTEMSSKMPEVSFCLLSKASFAVRGLSVAAPTKQQSQRAGKPIPAHFKELIYEYIV
jgi:hypothetical protein